MNENSLSKSVYPLKNIILKTTHIWLQLCHRSYVVTAWEMWGEQQRWAEAFASVNELSWQFFPQPNGRKQTPSSTFASVTYLVKDMYLQNISNELSLWKWCHRHDNGMDIRLKGVFKNSPYRPLMRSPNLVLLWSRNFYLVERF